jgi:hypothetical protein
VNKYLIAISSLALTSCAQTNSGAISAGKDTYVISRQAGAFPTGKEPLLAEALAEANVKCENDKRKMTLVFAVENQGPFILGNYPKATIIFKCE